MLTAACALRLGLEPVLVLKRRGVWQRRGNQVLNYLMGVDVRFVQTGTRPARFSSYLCLAARVFFVARTG